MDTPTSANRPTSRVHCIRQFIRALRFEVQRVAPSYTRRHLYHATFITLTSPAACARLARTSLPHQGGSMCRLVPPSRTPLTLGIAVIAACTVAAATPARPRRRVCPPPPTPESRATP